MRLLLTPSSKKNLFLLLKEKYNCKSIKELSKKINIPIKTLQGWFYLKDRCIPESILEKDFIDKIEIIDKKEDNWGQSNGGRKSYLLLVKSKGIEETKRRQSLGGTKAAMSKEKKERESFKINIADPLFLEFYGILLGDGWLSNFFTSSKKRVWLIGISCNLLLDMEFINYCRKNVKTLFKREGFITKRFDNNSVEFLFSNKLLLLYLNKTLSFPIGKKENLTIHNSIYSLGYDKVKHVIRGIFDTDGSFYLERNRKGIPSFPIISIHMKEPILIKQLTEILRNEGFRVNFDETNNQIKLKGRIQLSKWMNEIGSSNPKHLNKIALVAQPG